MTASELLLRVKKLEFQAKNWSNATFKGAYHSAFKGQGVMFREVRDYTFGDDTRAIDWNVTARYNEPFVKVFEEERELSMVFLVDMSKSTEYGSARPKKELILDLMATLGTSVNNNQDKVGAVFFNHKIEKYIQPKKGRDSLLTLLKTYLNENSYSNETSGTNIEAALNFLARTLKNHTTIVILSDFVSNQNFDAGLRKIAGKHDVLAIQICDPFEENLPDVGIIELFDPEMNLKSWVNTSDSFARHTWKINHLKIAAEVENTCKKNKIAFARISTLGDFMPGLRKFIAQRKHRI